MARPHEDRERHTLVDHRPGGTNVSFDVDAWCAIDIVAVNADRARAAISAYETLIERYRASRDARASAAILSSIDYRRVVSILEVDGHAGFGHVAAAWDDHHLYAQHRANAQKTTLGLYRVVEVAGDARFDTASSDRYDVERVVRPATSVTGLLLPLAFMPGFRGSVILGSEDGAATIIISRFQHQVDFDAFRTSALALPFLGPIDASGKSHFATRPVKTFGSSD